MATYDPSIPILSHDVVVDVPQIQENFESANTIINKDHFAFNDNTAANQGLHRKVSFPTAITTPSLGSNQAIIFPRQDQNDTGANTQLYVRNVLETIQLTSRFHEVNFAYPDPGVSSYGYWMLPGGRTSGLPGLIIGWGFQAIDTDPGPPPNTNPWSHTHIVHFNPIANYNYSGGQTYGFPNNLLAIVCNVCNQDSSPSPKTCSIDVFGEEVPGLPYTRNDQFRIKLSSIDISGIYYIAIGN